MKSAAGDAKKGPVESRYDPQQSGQQKHDGGQQFKTADDITAKVSKQLAYAIAEERAQPVANGAENMLRIRMLCELVRQGSKKYVTHPQGDHPGSSGA